MILVSRVRLFFSSSLLLFFFRRPVHVLLDSGEYAKIKTETKPRIGQENDPIAELTKFGWFLMSPGTEFDKNIMLFTQTSQSHYEERCKLDVLGLRDVPDHDQSMVFDEFKERLTRSPEGWYETTLLWNFTSLTRALYASPPKLRRCESSMTPQLERHPVHRH